MILYSKIIDEKTGLCDVGTGTNVEFYKSIGFVELDVQQSDIDGMWYLTEKCPMKSDEEKAKKVKNELIEQYNYPLKAKVAYTGVRFDYQEQELVFETNKDSMSMISTTLVGILAGQTTFGTPVTTIDNWKCRKVIEPYEPVAVTFTTQQFMTLVNFGKTMISQAFAVEEQINQQIQSMTVEQLNNTEYVEAFKIRMKEAYDKVPVKIEDLLIS